MSILRIELRQCRNMLGSALSAAACPYYRTGTEQCVTGCWEEPRCITNEPLEGWEEQARRDADAAAGWARDIAHDARGDHRLVKAARDLMRQAQKAALR